ncbi:dentin matrix acidic phosphoprotein 1-like [Paramacrobiotus metropolitanus]|uniref:dentin matrix acidic phosphoprotein 1-like n=1 Tax=Paramacrobiotus metropolitanus TaxID=2943436 RepID=UPI0024457856|nr:dentin matrix acidic phosphoprotein 1-like [Paramacrobiotus metropolitanus]
MTYADLKEQKKRIDEAIEQRARSRESSTADSSRSSVKRNRSQTTSSKSTEKGHQTKKLTASKEPPKEKEMPVPVKPTASKAPPKAQETSVVPVTPSAEEEGLAGEGEYEEQMEAEDAPSGENALRWKMNQLMKITRDDRCNERSRSSKEQITRYVTMNCDRCHPPEESETDGDEDDEEDTVQEDSEDDDPAPRSSKDESKSKSSKEESKPSSSKTDTKSKKSEKSDKGTDEPGKTGTEKSRGKSQKDQKQKAGKRKDHSPSDDEDIVSEESEEDDEVLEIDESLKSSTTTPKKGVIQSATSPEEKPKSIAIKRAINMGEIMAASTQKERREKAQKEKGNVTSRESTASERSDGKLPIPQRNDPETPMLNVILQKGDQKRAAKEKIKADKLKKSLTPSDIMGLDYESDNEPEQDPPTTSGQAATTSQQSHGEKTKAVTLMDKLTAQTEAELEEMRRRQQQAPLLPTSKQAKTSGGKSKTDLTSQEEGVAAEETSKDDETDSAPTQRNEPKSTKWSYYLPKPTLHPRLKMELKYWKIAITDAAMPRLGGSMGVTWDDLSNFFAVNYELGIYNIERDRDVIRQAVESLLDDNLLEIKNKRIYSKPEELPEDTPEKEIVDSANIPASQEHPASAEPAAGDAQTKSAETGDTVSAATETVESADTSAKE